MTSELRPTTIYSVYGSPLLDESRQQALLFLYQPIIGAEALSLYLNLSSDITVEGKSPELMHADLLAAIDNGLAAMLKAREKLEGIGLLNTFQKEDNELGMTLFYQLIPPLMPIDFFQDALMCYLLMEKIGERRFQRLVERFRPKVVPTEGLTNITKRFRDSYRFEETRFAANTELFDDTHDKFIQPKVAASTFDWTFFNQQLEKFSLTLEEEDQKKIEALHQMYGIDEMEMLDFAVKSSERNQIQLTFLRNLIVKSKQIKSVDGETEVQLADNRNLSGEFSKAEQEIIRQSERIPPIKYLQAIKKQKGGYETNQEIRLIEDLLSRHLFPNSVVNILINYILVIQNQAVINQNYLNAIANDWAQRKIQRPEEAIVHVRQADQKLVKKKTTNRRNNAAGRKTQGRKEILPSHIKEPPKEKKISPEKEAELNRKLAEYLNKEGES
ncbi:DnaD domain protein [Candidatus Enterococcus ferrettii]|uniref:Replication initiation and membrane attachment protein n=1 Tax=Candidatus Enterococcus ferrettii TaxID=2815324 RepID=A0ABV0EQE1_9ENTE|nr:DnaD domain protein [Enterococcus sp. 665A]